MGTDRKALKAATDLLDSRQRAVDDRLRRLEEEAEFYRILEKGRAKRKAAAPDEYANSVQEVSAGPFFAALVAAILAILLTLAAFFGYLDGILLPIFIWFGVGG